MHERFLNVFGQVQSPDDIKAAFSDAFVERLTVSKSTKILQAEVTSRSLIPNRYKALMERAIFDTVSAAQEVKIHIKYRKQTEKSSLDILILLW